MVNVSRSSSLLQTRSREYTYSLFPIAQEQERGLVTSQATLRLLSILMDTPGHYHQDDAFSDAR
ncbi:hypothetical protein RB213_003897 [Colletotrichum asianum]